MILLANAYRLFQYNPGRIQDHMRRLITGGTGLLGMALQRSAPASLTLHSTHFPERALPVPLPFAAHADAVGRLLANSSLRLQLGRAAWVRFQESYTLTPMLDQHIQLYRCWHKQ